LCFPRENIVEGKIVVIAIVVSPARRIEEILKDTAERFLEGITAPIAAAPSSDFCSGGGRLSIL
jgi:hypothetical protein